MSLIKSQHHIDTNSQEFEVDNRSLLGEHSDKSYSDLISTDDSNNDDEPTVLERLYKRESVRGFPTLTIDHTSDEELETAVAELCGELIWDSAIAIPRRAYETGVIRKAVLYLPNEVGTDYCWSQEELQRIADRTGMLVVEDHIQYEKDGSLWYSLSTGKGFQQLVSNEMELLLFVPHHYARNRALASVYYDIGRDAREAGLKCKYLIPKLVRTKRGSTQLDCVNTLMYSFRASCFGRDEAHSREACFHRGQLFENGCLISRQIKKDTQLIINLVACDYSDLQAEIHAIRVAETLSLPIASTEGTPQTLDNNGRFPAFDIPTDKPLTVIRSPHGAGKSFNLARFCEKVCRQGHAVIHILPRNSLVQQSKVSFGAVSKAEMVDASAFKDVASVSTLLFPTDTDGVGNQIAFCVESLAGKGLALGFDLLKIYKALAKTENTGKRIYLVLDEFPSVMNSVLTSDTIASPALTMKVFRDLLRLVTDCGGSVLALSADISRTEVRFLIDCLGLRDEEGKVKTDEIFCVSPAVRYPQPYKREIVLSTKKEATLQRIYEAIERRSETTGGAVLVMMNSLKVETPVSTINLDASIREKFPDARTLVLDSRTKQTDKEAQAFLSATPEAQMRLLCDYDCVIATSIIEAGLNWDNRAYDSIPDDFVRSIFVIDNGRWGSDNILQASMRVRNQSIPCEVFTPKRNHSLERPALGYYPTLSESLDYQQEVIEKAYAFASYADDERMKDREAPAWKDCYARFVAKEQAQKCCPRKTLEVLAKSNGHAVVLTEDSLPQATANAINTVLRQTQEDTIALRSAVLAGVITVEGGERIRKGESTLELERHKAGRWTPDAIRERLTVLVELNEQLGQAELDNATTPAQKGKVRKKIANLGYLTAEAQQEFEVMNCLSVYGTQARENLGSFIKDKAKREQAEALLRERVSGDEWFVPRINDEEVETLSRRRTLTEREAVLVEKQRVRAIGHLDADLTADTTQLSAEAWCRFAYSFQPTLLMKRMLMTLDDEMVSTYGKLIVGEMPYELTAGRVENKVALLQSAETLCLKGVGSHIKGFERRFLVDKGDSHLSFVASCLGVDETDDCLNAMRHQKGLTKADADAFLIKEFKAGHKQYPQMNLMNADDEGLIELAELIHEHRKELSALIPSAMKSIRRSDGKSNAVAYLSQVFNEIGLGSLQKIGEDRSNRKKVAVIVLIRKEGMLSKQEGHAYLVRKWNTIVDTVAERQKFLAISDF